MNESVHVPHPVDAPPTIRRIALAGNPNVGKTSVFNALTGLRQKVANYPGVTVERKIGTFSGPVPIQVVDLPGAYSLDPHSQDERVVSDVLSGRIKDEAIPDLVICVVDASNLERNLYLASQIIDLGIPVIVAMNMVDVAEELGITVNVDRLSNELGVPVIPVSAHRLKGIDILKEAAAGPLPRQGERKWELMPAMREPIRRLENELASLKPDWPSGRVFSEALRAVTSDVFLEFWREHEPAFAASVGEVRSRLAERNVPFKQAEIIGRYNWLAPLVARCVDRRKPPAERTVSDRIDAVTTHSVFGPFFFLLILAVIFQSVFSWAVPAMEAIEWAVSSLGTLVYRVLPAGFLTDLIVDGAIAGVGNILVFLPQILLLFFFLGLMEDTGYMARSAFVMDRFMRRVGLSGGSVVPLLSSYACAIPGIMAARTLDNERDRLITIMVAPLMSCSARLPVYTLFIAAFIPTGAFLGVFGYQGMVMLFLYLLGTVMAFVAAWVMKRFVFKGEESYFAMELPPYRLPQMKQVLWRMFERSKAFVTNAGSIIFVMSVLMWLLASFPRTDPPATVVESRNEAEAVFESAVSNAAERLDMTVPQFRTDPRVAAISQSIRSDQTDDSASSTEWPSELVSAVRLVESARDVRDATLAAANDEAAAFQVRRSFIGRFGRAIEPVMQPLGFDWKMTTGIIAAFSAREVIISVLATLYSVSDADESSAALREQLRADRYPDTGEPVYTPLVAMSLLIFFVFALQCMSTLAVARRETNSWRWPALMWLYMTGLAYILSLIVYQGGKALGLG